MPSYLEKEQILALPPYLANTAAILNTFQTKVQYWGAGAAQVKGAYDKYLGMDLSREDNQGKLQEFMAQAKEQMKKTTQSDLSIGDNQVRALNIFDPLVNGQSEFSKNILGDNALTSHYKNQLATAESYRTRDGGKEYSDTNVAYLTQHLEDFKNEGSADSWKNYYGRRRFYTPYHDYSKEIRELMEAYKPNEMSKTVPSNGMYFHTIEDKSTTTNDALRYINANLSDKARRQMGIEASVNFHGRDADLLKSVRADWDADVSKYTSYAKDLEAQIRIEKDPTKKANLEAERTLAMKRVGNLNNNIGAFNSGDYSEVIKNKEAYANKLYTNNLLSGIASGYTRTDYNEKYSVDQAAVAQMNETGRNLRFQSQMEFDRGENALDRALSLQIAEMKNEAKDGPGSKKFSIPGLGDTQTSVNLTEDEKKSFALSNKSLDDDLKVQNETQKQIYSTIHDRLVSAGKIQKTDDPDMRAKVIDTYLKSVDERYQYINSKEPNQSVVRSIMEREYYPGIMESIDGLRETNQVIYSIKQVKGKLADASKADLQEMAKKGETKVKYADAIPGKSSSLYIDPKVISDFVFSGDRSIIKQVDEKEYRTKPVAGGTMSGQFETKLEDVRNYYYNGRKLSVDDVNGLVSKINTNVNKKFDTDLVENKNIWKFGPNSKKKLDVAKQEILSTITVKDKEPKEGDYQVIGYSEDGNLYFKANDEVKGAKKVSKDFDGRTIYTIPSETFKIDVNSAIPENAKGLKYFLDKQTPFLKPGKTVSTPADKNFFQVGNVSYRVEAQRTADGAVTYNLYEKKPGNLSGDFVSSFNDFYSLAEYANAYPQVKTLIK